MGRANKGLTVAFVRSVTKPGRYYDGRGEGLMLRVAPGGSKQWFWRGTVRGRRRDYGLGAVRYTSLAEARQIAFEYRKIARGGGDPRAERTLREVPTFMAASEVVIGLYSVKWKPGSRSADQWCQSLSDYVYPLIGTKPVSRVSSADVMAVLTPIWATKPTTAKRVRQRISAVMAWAVAEGHRTDDPAGAAITKALPKTSGPRNNLAAVHHRQAADAYQKIKTTNGHPPTRLAAQFAILTATRSGEVRGARWDEIDQQTATWTIPAERMKANREHRVPLTPEALRVLTDAARHSNPTNPTALVFPNRAGGELGAWQLSKLIAGLDLGGTLHGFRSTFRDWAADQSVPREIAELCLAHRIGSATEQAYARSDILHQRRKVMQNWAQHLTHQNQDSARQPVDGVLGEVVANRGMAEL